jgi:hypothetical protein
LSIWLLLLAEAVVEEVTEITVLEAEVQAVLELELDYQLQQELHIQ